MSGLLRSVLGLLKQSGRIFGLIDDAGNEYGVSYVLASSGCPVGIAPTGSIGNNGALILGTALQYTYASGLFLYFPAGAIYSGSPAGAYWVVMSSTTAGTVYNNMMGNIPSVVPSPNPFVTTGPGAYTGVVGSACNVAAVTLPGGSIGPNGSMRITYRVLSNNSANYKSSAINIGATAIYGINSTTVIGNGVQAVMFNRGVQNSQYTQLTNYTNGGAATPTAVDTSINQIISLTVSTQTSGAETIIMEGFTIEVLPSA
jgi:hypothetical protein